MVSPRIYHHPIEERLQIVQALHQYLPTSLPLYRRLQFQHFTPDSHILCSLDPTSYKNGHYDGTTDAPWVAAYVDRSARPETEVWLFCTWESGKARDGGDGEGEGEEERRQSSQAEESLIRALMTEIRQTCGLEEQSLISTFTVVPVEALATGPVKSSADHVDRSEYEGHLANPNIMLCGSIHERTVAIMKKIGVLTDKFIGADLPYNKYLFDLSVAKKTNNTLPPNLIWGEVKPEHLALVRSRTRIPRQDRTLRQLPSLAIFPESNPTAPIAWSFLGPDGSLSSLHVEPEYRGLRLAKTLASELFARGTEVYWEQGARDIWAHADVSVDNGPSNGVCRGLGGVVKSHVYWVRVDLSEV